MEAYHFTDAERFLAHVADDGFLEWVEFLDYTREPRCQTRRRVTTFCSRSMCSAEQIRHRYPDALLIFVDAPSDEAQEARLRGRGDPEEKVRPASPKRPKRKPKRSNST